MTITRRWVSVIVFPLVVFMLPVMAASQTHSESEIVEFLEGVEEYTAHGDGNYTITTRAFWLDKPSVSVAVVAEGTSEELVQVVESVLSGNATTGSQWNELLSEFERAPQLGLADTEGANVKVVLTNAGHPEGKPGMTRLYVDKATGEIVKAEVYVYSADAVTKQGMLEYVVGHELGHALGLSHSTDPESLMHPLLERADGNIVNRIGSCEASGLSSLYIESRIGSEDC